MSDIPTLPYRAGKVNERRSVPIYEADSSRSAVRWFAGVAILAACASLAVAFNDPFWGEARTCIAVFWCLGPPVFLLIDAYWLFDQEDNEIARAKHRMLQANITRLWAGMAALLAYAYVSAYLRRIAKV